MPLSELQRKKLIADVNKIKIDVVLKYFLCGDIDFPDVPNISPDRKEYIEQHMPSKAQMEWDSLAERTAQPSQLAIQLLNGYIKKWELSLPKGNHVDEARHKVAEMEAFLEQQAAEKERLQKQQAAAVEENDWQAVDPFSKPSLMAHLRKYPQSVHRNDIDDSVWGLTDTESVPDINAYLAAFPGGIHAAEAHNLLDAIVEWEQAKKSDDVVMMFNYIASHPQSPFMQQAQLLLMGLKQREVQRMKNAPNSYSVPMLMHLLSIGVFSDDELIVEGVVTQNVLHTLRNMDIKDDLPDIKEAQENSTPECKEGYTDVYFFGIPSTGKTCVLMGLTSTPSLQMNLASAGGDYAAALQQYTEYGVAVPQTPGEFVTTLEGTISDYERNSDHKVNLVEMSGEEFAFKITGNPDHVFNFEDMGTGATRLLSNSNKKVFFLIIDPTTDIVRFNREYTEYDEETGEKTTRLKHAVVNQKTMIPKIINIMQNPDNAEIMKRVDSIHIIMTKADTLGSPAERDANALKQFNLRFGKIVPLLVKLCEEYNINSNTNYRPKLFTYSLGTFYVGGLYEYDETDSDRLVEVIKNATHGEKPTSFFGKVKDLLN